MILLNSTMVLIVTCGSLAAQEPSAFHHIYAGIGTWIFVAGLKILFFR